MSQTISLFTFAPPQAMSRPLPSRLSFRHVLCLVAGLAVLGDAAAQVNEADSLVLVEVYNTNGGASWVNSTDWLTASVDSWYGVSVADGRITALRLPNNGLTGTLPASLSTLDSLHVLNVSGNALTSVPTLDALTALDTLNVASNRLTFAHIVPNVQVATSFSYAPQDSVGTSQNLVVLRGSAVNIASATDMVAGNSYQWRRNGQVISGQTAETLALNCVTPTADNGSYSVRITNPAAAALTLHRRTVSLTVNDFAVSAGPNQSVCQDGVQMAATVPPIGSGTWSVVTGSGIISNPIDPFATVTGLGLGANTFRWNISTPGCPNVAFADVIIVRSQPPVPAQAGADKFNCGPSDTLSAIVPAIGAGQWSVVFGNAVLADPLHPNTPVSGLSTGENIFRWQVTNGACQSVFDEMKIIRQIPHTAPTVGPDTSICGLEATLFSVKPVDGNGNWELSSGTGWIDNIYSNTPSVTGLSEGPNVFRWVTDNACNQPAFSEQTITVYNFTYANAGSDTTILYNSFDPFTIGGSPSAYGGNGEYTYIWEMSAPLDDVFAANPQATFSDTGSYTFTLVVTDGNGCQSEVSEVTITVSLSDVLNVPSLFTPNNDGNNDFLVIPGVEGHPDSRLEIINRHGVSVFETTAYRNNWDGTPNKGTFIGSGPLPADTYYYVLDLNNGREPQTGYIVIKR
jgi:gliding motility-associated-like protein